MYDKYENYIQIKNGILRKMHKEKKNVTINTSNNGTL